MKNKAITKNTATDNLEHWLKEEQLEMLTLWARDLYTNREIAEKMGISEITLQKYRRQHPEIDDAIRKGKEVVDECVESALLRSALGAKTRKVKVVQVYKLGILTETHKEVIEREHVPSVLACTVWLYNRQRDRWKKNPDNDVFQDESKSINITITRTGRNTESQHLLEGLEIEEDGNE